MSDPDEESATAAGSGADSGQLVRVDIPDIKNQKCIVINPKDSVWSVKQLVLEKLNQDLPGDPLNYSLYLPPQVKLGKQGKFLDDGRTLSDYTLEGEVPRLELKHKCREYHGAIASLGKKVIEKAQSKQNQKKFVESLVTGNVKKAEKLLETGLDPNFITEDGNTPLGIVCGREGHKECIMPLVSPSGGAHLDFRGKDGLTPLHRAAIGGNSESIKMLLNLGACPNVRDTKGLTPLYHTAIMGDDISACELLLSYRAEIGIKDAGNWTEMHQVAKYGHITHGELFLRYGADINAQNRVGNTPLHVAASHSQRSCGMMLLKRGADKNQLNFSNQFPTQVAVLCGHHSLGSEISSFSPALVERITEPPLYSQNARAFASDLYQQSRSRLPSMLFNPNIAEKLKHDRERSSPTPEPAGKKKESVSSYDHASESSDKDSLKSASTAPGTPLHGTRERLYLALPRKRYMATEDVEPLQEGDLTLRKDMRVDVLYVGSGGYWEGRQRGKQGWFPSIAIREVSEDEQDQQWNTTTTSGVDIPEPPRTPSTSSLQSFNDGFGMNANSNVSTMAAPSFPSSTNAALASETLTKNQVISGQEEIDYGGTHTSAPRDGYYYDHSKQRDSSSFGYGGPPSEPYGGGQMSGYNPQPTGYNPQPSGYNSQPSGYNPQPTGYNPQPSGYNPQPSGYNSQPTGYNSHPTGYNTAMTGYNLQPTGYNTAMTGYNTPPTGYGMQPTGYGTPPMGHGTPPTRYATPKESPSQPRNETGTPKELSESEKEALYSVPHKKRSNIRDVTIVRGDKGYGFAMRGVKGGDTMKFHPTPQVPALQYVGGIDPGGSADQAGLKEGDFILEVNGHNITYSTHEEVVYYVKQAGSVLRLKIITPVEGPSARRTSDQLRSQFTPGGSRRQIEDTASSYDSFKSTLPPPHLPPPPLPPPLAVEDKETVIGESTGPVRIRRVDASPHTEIRKSGWDSSQDEESPTNVPKLQQLQQQQQQQPTHFNNKNPSANTTNASNVATMPLPPVPVPIPNPAHAHVPVPVQAQNQYQHQYQHQYNQQHQPYQQQQQHHPAPPVRTDSIRSLPHPPLTVPITTESIYEEITDLNSLMPVQKEYEGGGEEEDGESAFAAELRKKRERLQKQGSTLANSPSLSLSQQSISSQGEDFNSDIRQAIERRKQRMDMNAPKMKDIKKLPEEEVRRQKRKSSLGGNQMALSMLEKIESIHIPDRASFSSDEGESFGSDKESPVVPRAVPPPSTQKPPVASKPKRGPPPVTKPRPHRKPESSERMNTPPASPLLTKRDASSTNETPPSPSTTWGIQLKSTPPMKPKMHRGATGNESPQLTGTAGKESSPSFSSPSEYNWKSVLKSSNAPESSPEMRRLESINRRQQQSASPPVIAKATRHHTSPTHDDDKRNNTALEETKLYDDKDRRGLPQVTQIPTFYKKEESFDKSYWAQGAVPTTAVTSDNSGSKGSGANNMEATYNHRISVTLEGLPPALDIEGVELGESTTDNEIIPPPLEHKGGEEEEVEHSLEISLPPPTPPATSPPSLNSLSNSLNIPPPLPSPLPTTLSYLSSPVERNFSPPVDFRASMDSALEADMKGLDESLQQLQDLIDDSGNIGTSMNDSQTRSSSSAQGMVQRDVPIKEHLHVSPSVTSPAHLTAHAPSTSTPQFFPPGSTSPVPSSPLSSPPISPPPIPPLPSYDYPSPATSPTVTPAPITPPHVHAQQQQLPLPQGSLSPSAVGGEGGGTAFVHHPSKPPPPTVSPKPPSKRLPAQQKQGTHDESIPPAVAPSSPIPTTATVATPDNIVQHSNLVPETPPAISTTEAPPTPGASALATTATLKQAPPTPAASTTTPPPPPPPAPQTSAQQQSSYKQKPVSDWEIEEVCDWLRDIGLGDYCENFQENEIKGEHLCDLSKDDLKQDLGIKKLGHQKTFITKFAQLKE